MNVAGSTVLDAAPRAVRELLHDPERLSASLPNVESFAWTDGGPATGGFAVTMRPALALGEIPVRTVWQRGDAGPDELRYRVEGRTDEHRVAFDVVLRLADEGGRARVGWEIAVHVTGTLRSAGQRVLVPIVDRQVRMALASAAEASTPR